MYTYIMYLVNNELSSSFNQTALIFNARSGDADQGRGLVQPPIVIPFEFVTDESWCIVIIQGYRAVLL